MSGQGGLLFFATHFSKKCLKSHFLRHFTFQDENIWKGGHRKFYASGRGGCASKFLPPRTKISTPTPGHKFCHFPKFLAYRSGEEIIIFVVFPPVCHFYGSYLHFWMYLTKLVTLKVIILMHGYPKLFLWRMVRLTHDIKQHRTAHAEKNAETRFVSKTFGTS